MGRIFRLIDRTPGPKKSAEVGGETYNLRRLVFGGKCVVIRGILWGEWVLAATHKRYPNFGHTPSRHHVWRMNSENIYLTISPQFS